MCNECRMSVCDGRCPNAPDPPQVFICSGCGDSIRDGDPYWDILWEQWCEDCIDNAKRTAREELLCNDCEAPIPLGDDFWEIMGNIWCEDCVRKAKGVAEYDPY